MAIASTSLISADEYLISLGQSFDVDNGRRAQVEQLINWVSVQVEDHLGYTLISGSSETEVFSGWGVSTGVVNNYYDTKHAPLIASPTPKLFSRLGTTTWSSVSGSLWSYTADEGRVYFTGSSYFAKGESNYKVVYDYGYANTAAVPAPIKQATMFLVKYSEALATSIGVAGASTGDGKNKSYTPEVPPIVARLLAPYVR